MEQSRKGTLLGVVAYLIWGFAALYWIQTQPVDARDLTAHRALYSVPVVAFCLLFTGRFLVALRLFKDLRTMAIMALAAALSASNWGIFLWAVTNGQATQASLGYLLLPLINVIIGLTIFGESIDRAQKLAVAFAVAGIAVQLWYFKGLPLVALGVALSFGFYGAIRKAVSVESLEGLFMKTLFMAPFALTWLLIREGGGLGDYGFKVDLFLLCSGIITAVPLMAYVAASRLLPLTALGLVFYIGPSAQLFVAIVVFEEPFSPVQLAAFALVWAGLLIVTWDNLQSWRRRQRQA